MAKLKSLFVAIAASIAAWLIYLTPAASAQEMNQPAVLIPSKSQVEIKVYTNPGADQPDVGYGLEGDRVTVLEQINSDEGYTWDHIRFDNSPYAEGWVRADHLSFQLPSLISIGRKRTQTYQSAAIHEGYLGEQLEDYQDDVQNNQRMDQAQHSQDPISAFKRSLLNLFRNGN